MAETVSTYAPPAEPLVATVLPNGQVVITHGTVGPDGVPVYNAGHIEQGPLDGEIFGVSKKLILLSLGLYLLLKK